jgi:hypothetical protein
LGATSPNLPSDLQLGVPPTDAAARQVALLTAELHGRDVELAALREQLRDSEREASWLREANKLRAQDEQEQIPPAPASGDGGHLELQTALEAAWQDLQDARNRIATLEEERDSARREVDELRIELYSKLELAKDEAIAAENRLTEQQHAFDDARETWVSDHTQLRTELEEAQHALLAQVHEISQLRQSLIPSVQSSAAAMDELPAHSFGVTQPVPLVNPSTFPGAPALPRPHYTAHRPDNEDGSLQRPSLSSLVGFETSPPAITEDTPDEPFAAGKAFRKPTKSFGFGRLFRS